MSGEAFNVVLLVWSAAAVLTFLLLLRVRAPYGRHTTAGWGPTLGHRLGWFVMELPALTVFACLILSGPTDKTLSMWVFLGAWQVHYLNRTILFPLRMQPSKKRMPVAIAASALFFNTVNGALNGYYLGWLATPYPDEWLTDWRFLSGSVLFVVGFVVNLNSDNILLRLRESGRYSIPNGGLFRWISCPNYLGEIVEWVGFALMTWSPAAAAFALWTAANLVPRAISNHHWYHERFPDYPQRRRAVIPHLL